jgi:hypothetical protein
MESSAESLKSHFIQTLIILEVKQIAESFKKIKAKRPAQLNRTNLPAFF